MSPIDLTWWTIAACPAVVIGLVAFYTVYTTLHPSDDEPVEIDEPEAEESYGSEYAADEPVAVDWGAKLAAELKKRQQGDES